ncbi:MAG: hypothetical protein WCF03_16675 [Nitrososphaeraceae archaeon]
MIVCRQGKKRDPLYTRAVNEYQERIIQATRKISNNYIDSQRDHQFTISIGTQIEETSGHSTNICKYG